MRRCRPARLMSMMMALNFGGSSATCTSSYYAYTHEDAAALLNSNPYPDSRFPSGMDNEDRIEWHEAQAACEMSSLTLAEPRTNDGRIDLDCVNAVRQAIYDRFPYWDEEKWWVGINAKDNFDSGDVDLWQAGSLQNPDGAYRWYSDTDLDGNFYDMEFDQTGYSSSTSGGTGNCLRIKKDSTGTDAHFARAKCYITSVYGYVCQTPWGSSSGSLIMTTPTPTPTATPNPMAMPIPGSSSGAYTSCLTMSYAQFLTPLTWHTIASSNAETYVLYRLPSQAVFGESLGDCRLAGSATSNLDGYVVKDLYATPDSVTHLLKYICVAEDGSGLKKVHFSVKAETGAASYNDLFVQSMSAWRWASMTCAGALGVSTCTGYADFESVANIEAVWTSATLGATASSLDFNIDHLGGGLCPMPTALDQIPAFPIWVEAHWHWWKCGACDSYSPDYVPGPSEAEDVSIGCESGSASQDGCTLDPDGIYLGVHGADNAGTMKMYDVFFAFDTTEWPPGSAVPIESVTAIFETTDMSNSGATDVDLYGLGWQASSDPTTWTVDPADVPGCSGCTGKSLYFGSDDVRTGTTKLGHVINEGSPAVPGPDATGHCGTPDTYDTDKCVLRVDITAYAQQVLPNFTPEQPWLALRLSPHWEDEDCKTSQSSSCSPRRVRVLGAAAIDIRLSPILMASPGPSPGPSSWTTISGQYTINGQLCANVQLAVEQSCIPGEPHNDAEGQVCLNDGQPDEAYCSYDVGPTACARCAADAPTPTPNASSAPPGHAYRLCCASGKCALGECAAPPPPQTSPQTSSAWGGYRSKVAQRIAANVNG